MRCVTSPGLAEKKAAVDGYRIYTVCGNWTPFQLSFLILKSVKLFKVLPTVDADVDLSFPSASRREE
jgi:hypothetical protein